MVLAEEAGLDLVEVAAAANPPVCRIMDYGKYKYEEKKKKAAGKTKGSAELKELKLRPGTDDHDLDFKLKQARRFLLEGDKVKVTVMFRGREMVHREHGYKQLDKVQGACSARSRRRRAAADGRTLLVDDPGGQPRRDRASRRSSRRRPRRRSAAQADAGDRGPTAAPTKRRAGAGRREAVGRQGDDAEDEDASGRCEALQEDRRRGSSCTRSRAGATS